MRKVLFALLITITFTFLTTENSIAVDEKYQVVIEESFYVVKSENQEKYLQIYREKLYPFWKEMEKMGIIQGDYIMFSQRVHTLEPLWTYKTLVKFTNYNSIDKWLEVRDEVYNKLFPGEGGYKAPRREIDKITEAHWDELIRQIPLGTK